MVVCLVIILLISMVVENIAPKVPRKVNSEHHGQQPGQCFVDGKGGCRPKCNGMRILRDITTFVKMKMWKGFALLCLAFDGMGLLGNVGNYQT